MLFPFNKLLVFLGVSVKQNVYLGWEKQYFPVARLLEPPSLIENKVGFYSFPPWTCRDILIKKTKIVYTYS